MCVTFVTCEVRVCGLRCRSGSSLYIYRVYLLHPLHGRTDRFIRCPGFACRSMFPPLSDHLITYILHSLTYLERAFT